MSRTRCYAMMCCTFSVFLSVWLFMPTKATAACVNLPASTLQVYYLKTVDRQNTFVTPNELKQKFPPEFLAVRHSVMLAVSNTVGSYDVNHRMISAGDGSVCDAPDIVRIGFGSTQRLVFLARPGADDECVRQYLLDHEEAHANASHNAVLRFIDEKRTTFQQGVIALKQTPAPNEEIARNHWRTGLEIIVMEARRQLIAEVFAASVRLDDQATLAAMARACGGKIDRLGWDRDVNP